MAENFPILIIDNKLWETKRTPNRINTKIPILRHFVFKLQKTKGKGSLQRSWGQGRGGTSYL